MSADDPDMPRPGDPIADAGRAEAGEAGGGDTAGPFPPEVVDLIERCRAIAERAEAADEAAEEAGTEAPPLPPEDVRALLDLAQHPEALRVAFPPVTLDDLRAWTFPNASIEAEPGPRNRDMPPDDDPGGAAAT